MKRFIDQLAQDCFNYKVRILVGDFNMAMFMVLMEFRARGFCINVVAINASRKDGPGNWCQHTGDSCILLNSTCHWASGRG